MNNLANVPGERRPPIIIGLVMISGLAVFFSVLGFSILDGFSLFQAYMIGAVLVGSGVTAILTKNHFGYDGVGGFLISCLSWASLGIIASVVSGTLILPAYGTVAGPSLFLHSILIDPITSTVGALSVVIIHFVAKKYRQNTHLPSGGALTSVLLRLGTPLVAAAVVNFTVGF